MGTWTTSALTAYNNLVVNGNVGIGNAAPSAKLDIAGNVRIADGTQ